MRPRLYIAGPYTLGDKEENVQKALDAAEEAAKVGWAPFVPHLSHHWQKRFEHPHEFWYAIDLPWVGKADALWRLPGESKGADEEVQYARLASVPVWYEDWPPTLEWQRDQITFLGGDTLGILAEIESLHDQLAKDYGDGNDLANLRGSEAWSIPAWVGAMIRAEDKIRKLRQYHRKGSLANESAEDSLKDLILYSILALELFRESNAK